MKRFLLALMATAVLVSPCFGEMNPYIAGVGAPSATESADYQLYWDPDDCATQADADSTSGSCDITGTLTDATIVDDGSMDYLSYGAVNDNLSLPLQVTDPQEVYVRIIAEVDSIASDSALYETYYDSDNMLIARITSSGTFYVDTKGTGDRRLNDGNDNSVESVYAGYRFVAEILYSVTNSVLSVRVCSDSGADVDTCGGSEPWDTTTEVSQAFTDMANDPTTHVLGEGAGPNAVGANVRIYQLEVRDYADAP